ncbi:hypothetical protein DEIPH_ctg013orf0021 [Deinococcus phoenicis]|uniref:Uncharacterized protein n=1 Tax=Deinococcus phoenicis TaxID=1476583 RepID=A0A016QS84_9DEIO|nr:hypothetical protein [Deinococcus phoenicis]EYB68918.1 hypothetical protein DEIPH_ctg013orf0021 [Deinococcus phoenicis]
MTRRASLPVRVQRFREQQRRPGRPTELTPEVSFMICEMVRLGCTYEVAAVAAGVAGSTFRSWKQRGREEPGSIYAEFLADLEEAEAQGEVVHLHTVSKAGPDGAKWILAARHPERYGQSTKVNVLVRQELDTALDALEAELTPEEYEKVLAALAKHAGG